MFLLMILNRFWRIFWVDATTAETIQLSLQDIATDRDARASGIERSTKSVLQWLSSVKHDWLIVFDNASDGVSEYMPMGDQGNFLFTSRNPNLARLVSVEDNVEVGDMEEDDAILLLLRSSRLDETSAQAKEAARLIVKELCCLPLAVDQAGAAIMSGLCSIDDYLCRYHQYRQDLLTDPTFKGASNYGRAVYATWDLSFKAIRAMGSGDAENAIAIMQTFAFFHHDNIGEDIIKRAAEAVKRPTEEAGGIAGFPPQLLLLDQEGAWDPLFFRKGIRILLSFSLLRKTAGDVIYSLHPLVHCWSRDSMSNEERQTHGLVASILLSSSITFGVTSEDFAYRRIIIPHVKALGNQIFDDDEQLNKFVLAFNEAGYWNDAEKLLVDILMIRAMVFGQEHPLTMMTIGSLAAIYQNQGRWKEAEELEVKFLPIRKKVLGEEHPSMILSMFNLALTYQNQGRWKEAEELGVQVMPMCKKVLGEEDLGTLMSMSSLSVIYMSQGRWIEAERLEVQVLEMCKKVLGVEHPRTLASIDNVAAIYRSQGRWKEAERLEVQVLETRKKVLGDEHPNVIISMGHLALTYQTQGRWKEAEELLLKLLEMSKKVLGEEHPDTLTSMDTLAWTYHNQGRLEEAEQLQVQVLKMRKKVLGEEHPHTLTSMGNLASIYQNQKRWKESAELQVQVLGMSKKVLGETHPNTLASMHNLASIYNNQGWWKEAQELES